jgi:hypothetical protein
MNNSAVAVYLVPFPGTTFGWKGEWRVAEAGDTGETSKFNTSEMVVLVQNPGFDFSLDFSVAFSPNFHKKFSLIFG